MEFALPKKMPSAVDYCGGHFCVVGQTAFLYGNILRCYQISACSIWIGVKSAHEANQTIKYSNFAVAKSLSYS